MDSDTYSNDFVRYFNPAQELGSEHHADANFCKIKDDTHYFGSGTIRPLNTVVSVDRMPAISPTCTIKNPNLLKVEGDPNSIDFYQNCCKAS